MGEYTKEDLINFEAEHETFVGIDSDGCVFDTMEVKQKRHFHPLIIKMWELEKIESQLREVAEFINLYSCHRGTNRFPALLKTWEFLKDHPGVANSEVELPPTESLRAYCESGLPLGNPTLESEVERTNDPELKKVLEWSLAVNKDIDENMRDIPPFKWACKAMEKIQGRSDVIVVSQTPEEALVKEWDLHGIDKYVEVIAGQELGTKSEHLSMAIDDHYQKNNTLMIGDAPGDMRAAESVGAWFYPINPGQEEDSWKRFCQEDYDKFLAGDFDESYQQQLNEKYEALLPSTPPWLEQK